MQRTDAVGAILAEDNVAGSTFIHDPQGVVRLVREGFEAGGADGEYKKFKDALAKLVK